MSEHVAPSPETPGAREERISVMEPEKAIEYRFFCQHLFREALARTRLKEVWKGDIAFDSTSGELVIRLCSDADVSSMAMQVNVLCAFYQHVCDMIRRTYHVNVETEEAHPPRETHNPAIIAHMSERGEKLRGIFGQLGFLQSTKDANMRRIHEVGLDIQREDQEEYLRLFRRTMPAIGAEIASGRWPAVDRYAAAHRDRSRERLLDAQSKPCVKISLPPPPPQQKINVVFHRGDDKVIVHFSASERRFVVKKERIGVYLDIMVDAGRKETKGEDIGLAGLTFAFTDAGGCDIVANQGVMHTSNNATKGCKVTFVRDERVDPPEETPES